MPLVNVAGPGSRLYVSGGEPAPEGLFASENGGESGAAGTYNDPWSLKYALTQLQAGDHLYVLPGDYTDTEAYETQAWSQAFNPANSGTEADPIIIESYVPRAAIVHKTIKESDEPDEHCPAWGIKERSYITIKNFTADGLLKARGENGTVGGPDMYKGVFFEGCDVIEGDFEGTDTSLTSGIAFEWMQYSGAKYCRVGGMVGIGNTSDNTACIQFFNSTDNVAEFNTCDAAGVYSGFGQKGGDCHRNVFRYNAVFNARDGDSGDTGAAFYNKADTIAAKFCDDCEYYGNKIWDSKIAFKQNHNCQRSLILNNTAVNVDWFYAQFQTNNIDTVLTSNLVYGDGSTRFIQLDGTGGSTPDLSVAITESNYNCIYNAGVNHAYWADGANSLSLANFRTSGQTSSMTGRDIDSITTDPTLVSTADGGDYSLQPGSPCIGTGKGGVDIGYTRYGVTPGINWA